MGTLEYYNDNASDFVNKTKDVKLTNIQNKFMGLLQKGDYILDLGCGSGRDTKVFLDNGFLVDAVDGAEEICNIVSKNLGIKVKHMLFEELDEVEKYDGVFACASLLHVAYEDLPNILEKISISLKHSGVFYMSFKYGNDTIIDKEKLYCNLNEEMATILINGTKDLVIDEIWMSEDNVPGRTQKWINVISKKR